MAQQRGADPLALVPIDDNEGHLGHFRLADDVASPPDNRWSATVFGLGHQRDMVDEVDLQEKSDFLLAELAFCREEPPGYRLFAELPYGGQHIGFIVGPQCANFKGTSIAQRLERRIVRRL